MGRIVRRFARFFEQEMRGNFKQGEWTPALVIPIAQYEVGQRLHEVVLAVNALGGAGPAQPRAAYFATQVVAAVATATIAAISARMQVPAGIVVTGSTYGVHIEQELVAGEITVNWEGIRLELYGDGAGISATVHGIFMTNSIGVQPTAAYYFQRMAENGGVNVTSAFLISVGAGGDIFNLFTLLGVHTAWDSGTVPPGAAVGRIACLVNGVQLYIPLWN